MPIKKHTHTHNKKKVKIDTQKYAVPPLIPIKTNQQKDLTFRSTFIRGPPYNANKNTRKKKINEKIKTKKKSKLEPQKYVYLRNTFIRGPHYNAYKNQKTNYMTSRNTFIRDPPYNAYKNTRKNKLNEKNKDKN